MHTPHTYVKCDCLTYFDIIFIFAFPFVDIGYDNWFFDCFLRRVRQFFYHHTETKVTNYEYVNATETLELKCVTISLSHSRTRCVYSFWTAIKSFCLGHCLICIYQCGFSVNPSLHVCVFVPVLFIYHRP